MAKEERVQSAAPSGSSSGGSSGGSSAKIEGSVSKSGGSTKSSGSSSGSSKVSKAGSNARAAIQAGRAGALANKQRQTGQTQASRYLAARVNAAGNKNDKVYRGAENSPTTGARGYGASGSMQGLQEGRDSQRTPAERDQSVDDSYLQASIMELARGAGGKEVVGDGTAFGYANELIKKWNAGEDVVPVVKNGEVKWERGVDRTGSRVFYDFDAEGNRIKTTDKKLADANDTAMWADVDAWLNYANSDSQTKADNIKQSARIAEYMRAIENGLMDNYDVTKNSGETLSLYDYLGELFDLRDQLDEVADQNEAATALNYFTDQYNDVLTRMKNGTGVDFEKMSDDINSLQSYVNRFSKNELLSPLFTDINDQYYRLYNREYVKNLEGQNEQLLANFRQSQSDARVASESANWLYSADVVTSDADRQLAEEKKAAADAATKEAYDAQQAVQAHIDQLNKEYRERYMTPEVEAAINRLSIPQLGKAYSKEDIENYLKAGNNRASFTGSFKDIAEQMRRKDQELVDSWNRGLDLNTQYYNWQDRLGGIGKSFGARTLGSVANIAAWGVNATTYANDEVRQAQQVYDAAARDWLTNPTPGNRAAMRDAEVDLTKAQNRVEGGATERTTPALKIEQFADSMDATAQEELTKAKEDLSKGGQVMVDLGSNALDMGFDAMTGLPLSSMFVRSMGSGIGEARRAGATSGQQLAYGAAQGGVEALTEKLTDGLGRIYGKGVATDIVEKAISRFTSSKTGANFMRVLFGAGGEGAEELLSGLAAPYLNWIIDEDARQNKTVEYNASELLYDYLLGGAMSMLMLPVEIKTGGYASKNAEIAQNDAAIIKKAENAKATGQSLTKPELRDLRAAQARQENTAIAGGLQVDKNGRIVVNNQSGQEGYIARHAETEAYKRAEEQAQDIPQAEPQQAAIDNQAESATIDQAEANEMAQSQNATLEGQEKSPAPAPKKADKKADQANANSMAASQAQTIEGQDTNPVQAPKNTEAATASETAQGEEQAQTQQETPENIEEAVKLEGNSQQEAQRKSVPSSDPEEAARAAKNEERRQADNAQVDRAFNAKSPTTFQGTGSDPNATVTYDPNTRSLTVKDADGNVIDRITDLNKRRAKKELNKLRRTERATEVAPAPAETKTEAEQTVQQAEPQQESPTGESETAQQIRSAESVDQLRKMFFEDPDSFADAYEEVTGEKLNQQTAPDDIADLYDRMHGEMQEEEAPAAEEETETEETAPTLEQNLPEEQKPLRERIQSNAISDTELETMLGDRVSRNELAKALGITSTARKNVEAGYRLYQLLNSELNARAEEVAKAEVLQQVKNGEIDSDDLNALLKGNKLTTEDVAAVIGRGGKDRRNLLGQYADYKNGLNPSSMTQADSKWLERANKKKAANAKTNEARKAAEAVSLEDQLKGEGVDEDNAGDALGGSDSTGSVERSAPVGSDDTGTAKGSNGRNVGTLFEPLTGRKYDAAENALNEEYERRGISGPEKDSLETIRNDGIERRSKKKIYILASNKVSKSYKTLLKIANKYGRNFLTIMDASESADVGESGFCHRSTSIFGPTFITHRYIPQSARSFANLDGQSVSHEYAHDFGTVYAEEHDGNRPDYLEGLKSVTSDLVKTGIIQDDKQANMRNLLLRMYAQKVGPNAIRGYLYAKYKNQVNGREKFNEAFEAYAKLNGKDKVTYIKENLPDAYKTFTTTAREEIMMELCSEGQYFKTALQSAGYDIKPFGEAARSWLERDGGVPQGFFNEIAPVVEQLNQDNLKWLEEQDKVRGGNAAVTSSETDAGTLSEATDLRDAEIEDLRRRLAEAEARAEANAQPTAENPYAVNRYYPDGATDTRTNKRVSEMRTAGEKVHAGSVSYERVSKKQIADAAETNLRTFGYEHELKYFENTPPRHADALDIEEAAQLFTKLDVERSFRETHGGKVRDTSLPADMDTLVSDAENLAQWVTEATGQAARVLCQTATLTPELKTLTNGRTTYLGNAEPGEVDPDSTGAKMYRIMDDHISYIQDIQDRLDRKEISREEATKEMLHELHEINVVRNVKKVFGKQGERMEQWEAKLLDRVAGSAQGYELLKAMAVGSVDRIASDFGTVGAINTVKQIRYLNLLSNFATKVNNILNNLESSTTGAISQNVGRALTNRVATDILDGDVPLAKDYSWQHGIGWGKNKELNRYMIDKGAESVLSLYYNLDVDEGVVDVDLGKGTARFNQNDGTFGRLMARLQFLSGLGMQTTDAMAIARSEKGMELGIDELGLSEARREVMKQDARQEARRRMYHGETKAAKAMLALRDAANTIQIPFTSDKTGKIGLGDIMMPFVQVPTNVAMRAMRSSPLGVLYGFGKYATGINALKRRANTANRVKALEEKRSKKVALTAEEMQFLNDNKGVKAPTDAEVRSLQRTLGESCTNAAIMVFAAGLSALGAIRDFDDEDDEDMKRLAREKGYTGLQINLSALLNGGKWNDDGDVVIGGNWLEVMALPVAAGYSIFHSYNEDTNGGADVFKAVAMSPFSSLTQLLDAAEEIPGIKQASEIWNAYENLQQYDSLDKRISKSWAGIAQYAANTASSFVIPNLVAQFAAGRDNTVRDIYNADTSLEVAKNIIQNKVPWWRDQLPEAKSSLGETRKYGENKAMGLLNRMILPGTGVQVYRKSALEKEYEALGKSGNGNVAAKTSAPTAIKIDGQEWPLNANERRKYDEMYTPLVRQYHEQLINSDYYKELPAELKQEALQDTRSLAERLTKEYTLRNKDGCEAEIDFKNWERAVSNNPEKAVEFELAKMGAKACYTKEELTDFKAMDHYLDTEYKNLDPELKDVLDASYARLDSMADAREKTGMSSEQYETFRKLWKSYDDAVKNKTENDESYSGFNRNLIVDIYDDPNATEAQKAWAADNFRLWMNTPVKLDSPQKIVKNTSLSWKEADEWLDLKANTKPAEGYKELPQNQRLMMVRDSSFPESKKWELIEVEASDSAWAKLKPFKDEGKSVAYALEHARWYKATRYSNYKAMRFDTIYPNT